MKSGSRIIVFSALALIGSAIAAAAQAPATSFEQLARWVRIGDTVYVTDGSGREVRGEIADVSASSLKVTSGGGMRQYVEADVFRIQRRAPDPLSNGALIGLGVGAGFATAVAVIACATDYCHNAGAEMALAIGVYGGLGAAIGVGVDAMIPAKKVTIFRRDAGRARLGLAPILSPGRTGLGLSVSF